MKSYIVRISENAGGTHATVNVTMEGGGKMDLNDGGPATVMLLAMIEGVEGAAKPGSPMKLSAMDRDGKVTRRRTVRKEPS